jgi:hypothetical protein
VTRPSRGGAHVTCTAVSLALLAGACVRQVPPEPPPVPILGVRVPRKLVEKAAAEPSRRLLRVPPPAARVVAGTLAAADPDDSIGVIIRRIQDLPYARGLGQTDNPFALHLAAGGTPALNCAQRSWFASILIAALPPAARFTRLGRTRWPVTRGVVLGMPRYVHAVLGLSVHAAPEGELPTLNVGAQLVIPVEMTHRAAPGQLSSEQTAYVLDPAGEWYIDDGATRRVVRGAMRHVAAPGDVGLREREREALLQR